MKIKSQRAKKNGTRRVRAILRKTALIVNYYGHIKKENPSVGWGFGSESWITHRSTDYRSGVPAFWPLTSQSVNFETKELEFTRARGR